MERFNYKAISAKGRIVRGVLQATDDKDLYHILRKQGLELVDAKKHGSGFRLGLMKGRVHTRDLIQFFVQLEQLQGAGVSLLDSLDNIRDAMEAPALRDITAELHREVSSGKTLSEAMADYPKVFGHVFRSLIQAGEETGNMQDSYRRLINHLKWSDAMRSRVKKAVRYPAILLIVIVAVVALMMGYVVPQIVSFLNDIKIDLPPLTVALIATSEWFKEYWWAVPVVPATLWGLLKTLRALSEGFTYRTDSLLLRLPLFGRMLRKIYLARFAHTFAVMFLSGMDILRCLDAARRTVPNLVLKEALERAREQVGEGNSLALSLGATGEFPSLVTLMVQNGEETGNLPPVLEQVAEFYEHDVDNQVDAMIQMIEPALTLVLGGTVLWIAAGVFGPIYNSFETIGQM